MKITTRTIMLGKDYAHTLKFKNGRIYDITPTGAKLRGKVKALEVE